LIVGLDAFFSAAGGQVEIEDRRHPVGEEHSRPKVEEAIQHSGTMFRIQCARGLGQSRVKTRAEGVKNS
jgi:hypothetical protein